MDRWRGLKRQQQRLMKDRLLRTVHARGRCIIRETHDIARRCKETPDYADFAGGIFGPGAQSHRAAEDNGASGECHDTHVRRQSRGRWNARKFRELKANRTGN